MFHTPNDQSVNPQGISDNPEFHSLRRAHRRFGTLATFLSVGAFLLYVLLSSFAPDVMNQILFGHLTLGLALGLGQFVVMGVTVWSYVRHMRTRVDPLARRFRSQLRHNESALRRGNAVPRPRTGQTQATRGFRAW